MRRWLFLSVIPGLVPGIYVMAGINPAMTG